MPLYFNSIFAQEGIVSDRVRLLRHQDKRSEKGRTPYELWRDDRPAFEIYQGCHGFNNRSKLRGDVWASFVVNHRSETILAGIYSSVYLGINHDERHWPHTSGSDAPGTVDEYRLTPDDRFSDLCGRVVIAWGSSERAWIQRADNQNKVIVRIDEAFKEPEFPGFTKFVQPLSAIERLPVTWIAVLSTARGIYLLTCPKTREQYVGQASGSSGFFGRWQTYVQDGHGGNVGLKTRDPSDYQVSILEVVGSSVTADELYALEILWKSKLQSRQMGLNKN